ncbi:MAG TPA: hypothetical protein VFZ84_09845 [Burkholderiales bacterium]
MKRIDAEIAAVEERIGRRKAVLGHTASAVRQRTLQRMASPAVLAGALALGFVVAGGFARRKAKAPAPDRRKSDKVQPKGFALGTLLMTGATWFVRSQFGGPVGLANFVLAKVRDRRSPATAVPAQIPR